MLSHPFKPILWSKVILVIGVLGVGLCETTGIAASPNSMTINSDSMIAYGKTRKTIFEKSVVLKREDMVIHADRMIVYFKKDRSGKSGKSSEDSSFGDQVDVIDAQGHVIIEKEDGKATSGRAVYYKDEEKVVLTDSPVAWQNGTRVTGTKMTIFLKEERSIVEGGSRVVIEESEGEQ